MAVCDKWVALKVVEFLFCVACLVAKRVSTDDEARLALLLQKLSREWSLLNSVTWDSVGGAFADAVYGGYVVITSGLLLGRIFAEVPRGRRILEGWFLGMGMLFFLVLGGLELASIDTVPYKLIVNASVLGALSLVVAALFLLDLMGPRIYTAAHHSQTDVSTPVASKKVSISTQHISINGTTNSTMNGTTNGTTNGQTKEKNGRLPNGKQNGHIASEKTKAGKDTDVEKGKDVPDGIIKKDESRMFDQPKHGYTKIDEQLEEEGLARSKYGSLRNEIEGGNYIRLSDPLADNDRLHYERELAKFNEKYFRDYLEVIEGRFIAKEDYLPEPQTPQFAKVKTGRLKDLYDDESPTYEKKRTERASKSPSRVRTVATPTLQQLEDYLKESNRSRRADTPAVFPMEAIAEKELDDGRASGTPTDPGFVRYSSDKWPDKRESRTPRHSPTH